MTTTSIGSSNAAFRRGTRSLIILAALSLGGTAACSGDGGGGGGSDDVPAETSGDATGDADVTADAGPDEGAPDSGPDAMPDSGADTDTGGGSCEGQLGCGCGAGCDTGLECIDGTCTLESAALLEVSGGDARACDIALTTMGRKVEDVVFPAGVRGKMRTRNERTAIALLREADEVLGGAAAAVVFEGADPVAAGEITGITATCYDRRGAVDGGAAVTAR